MRRKEQVRIALQFLQGMPDNARDARAIVVLLRELVDRYWATERAPRAPRVNKVSRRRGGR